MDIAPITTQELDRTKGRRWTDRHSTEVYVAAVVLAGAMAKMAFDLPAGSTRARVAMMLGGAAIGAVMGTSIAKTVRTRNPMLLAPAVVGGLLAGVLAIVVAPTGAEMTASPTGVAAATSTTEVRVESGVPVPLAALGPPLTCTVDLTDGIPSPDALCDGRVEVTTIGVPTSGVSAWWLTSGSSIVLESPMPDLELVRTDTSKPECYGEDENVVAHTPGGVPIAAWAEQASMLVISDAAVGAQFYLWSECATPNAGTGIDTVNGWVLTIR